jgi:hypothetical protein
MRFSAEIFRILCLGLVSLGVGCKTRNPDAVATGIIGRDRTEVGPSEPIPPDLQKIKLGDALVKGLMEADERFDPASFCAVVFPLKKQMLKEQEFQLKIYRKACAQADVKTDVIAELFFTEPKKQKKRGLHDSEVVLRAELRFSSSASKDSPVVGILASERQFFPLSHLLGLCTSWNGDFGRVPARTDFNFDYRASCDIVLDDQTGQLESIGPRK